MSPFNSELDCPHVINSKDRATFFKLLIYIVFINSHVGDMGKLSEVAKHLTPPAFNAFNLRPLTQFEAAPPTQWPTE